MRPGGNLLAPQQGQVRSVVSDSALMLGHWAGLQLCIPQEGERLQDSDPAALSKARATGFRFLPYQRPR